MLAPIPQSRNAMTSKASLALMKFLSDLARQLGVSKHIYVVGGAVRNFVIGQPIKDLDVVVDTVALGKDSAWFAEQIQRAIPAQTNLATNNYGVALLHVTGDWFLGDENLKGEDIEIANARKESYGGEAGKGYKPHMVEPATIEEDVVRREFTFNTLLWRLHDLADGPDKAEILDLTGCGLRDLQDGVMRCPTSPDKTFSDDPSRMVRAVKFLVKYGFRISLEVERSIQKNKQKLKEIPHAHLSNMLINTFLREPTGKKALIEMDRLGLLGVIKEIAQTEKPFREALAGWADKEARIEFLFVLMDFGLPSGRRLAFLDPHQQVRVRDVTVDLSHDAADAYVQVLAQPGKVADIPALMTEFDLKGPAVRQVTDIARRLMLANPELAGDGAKLTARVRVELQGGRLAAEHAAKTFNLNVDDPVLYGKFLNKPGVIKDFGKNDKGDPTLVIEPAKGGQTKEVKLFKVRYDQNRAEQTKEGSVIVRRKLANPNLPNEYHSKLLELRVEVARAKQLGLTNSSNLWLAWFMFYRTGTEWAAYVIDHLALPPKAAKPVEMAVRLFSKSYPRGKGPPSIIDWFEGNEVRFELLDAARAWPERSEESGIFRVGPFTVHNTIQAAGKALADAEEIITKAVRAVSSSGVPGFATMAYGDLFLVGQLARKNWAAWYIPAKDTIYLRPGVKGSSNAESARHLVHELGHRLWAKKLDREIKGKWVSHHTSMTIHRPERRLPAVGDVLPTIVNNKHVRVESYDQGGAYAVLVEATTGTLVGKVDRLQLSGWMQEADRRGKFPTLYAATDAEEHFCESLSLLTFDRLSGENLDAFNEIILGVSPASVARIASRSLQAIIHIDNATDGDENDPAMRGRSGLLSSLTLYEEAIVQDMMAHEVVIQKKDDIYTLRGHVLESDAVTELVGAGYLTDGGDRVTLSPMFEVKLRLYTATLRVAARYQNKKKIKTEDGDERTVYEYSEHQVKLRHREKAKRIEELRGKLGDLRKQVKSDLKSGDPKVRLTALVVGLMNDTYERVGNEGSAEDGHFGVTGWLVKHVTLGKGKATFKYVGKSGVKQEKETTDGELVEVLREAVEGKGKDDCIFDYEDEDGEERKVRAEDVNEYLKDFDITAKDIRGLHANREMQKQLRAIRSKAGKLPEDKKDREKQLKDEFKKALEATAAAVGHEASTLKSQYLVPGLEEEFLADGTVTEKMDKRGARLLIATKSDAEKEEEEAERLVRPPPPKKPPRDDLRRERMDVDDPDLDNGDDDLSLNFKKIAARVARRWFHRLAADEPEHKPGEVWKTEDGKWGAKNPEGQPHTFEDKEQAAAYAKGESEDEGEAKDPTKALGTLADALTSAGGKKIDEAKKTLLKEHPELEAELSRHMADYDKANRELAQASIKAESATGKDKKDATKAAEAALERREAVVETIRGLKPPAKPKPETPAEESEAPAEGESEPGSSVEEPDAPAEPPAEAAPSPPPSDDEISQALADLPDKTREKIEEILGGEGRAEFDKVLKETRKALTGEIKNKGVTAAMMKDAEKDPMQGVDTSKPAAVAQALAKQLVRTQLLHNPSNIGGKPLSETTLSEDQLLERSDAAYAQFKSVSAKTRAKALKMAVEQLKELPEDSPQAVELNRIIDGIHLARAMASKDGTEEDMQVTDAEGKPLRREFSESQKIMMKHILKTKDGAKVMLAARGKALYEKEGRAAVRTAFENMSDEDFVEVSKEQTWAPLAEVAVKKNEWGLPLLGPDARAFARAIAIDMATDEMTTMQGLLASAEGREKDPSSAREALEKAAQEAMAGESEDKIAELSACLEGDDADMGACRSKGEEIRRGRFKALWDWFQKKFGKKGLDPSDPSVARVRHVAEGGDLDVLEEPLIPEAQALAEKKQEYLKHVTDPKDRKRIQEMSPDDFKAMLAAISDEEDESVPTFQTNF